MLEKCPKCEGEVEKGYLNQGVWFSGDLPMKSLSVSVFGRKTVPTIAWRCRKCGYIEMYGKTEQV